VVDSDGTKQQGWRDITVTLQSDHLTRLAQRASPVQAVIELIWNSLDADADRVRVSLREGLIGALEAVEVSDNGTGMAFRQALEYFGRLGGSWKRPGRTTPNNNRPLHGKLGRGRFRAFGAGQVVEWASRYRQRDGSISQFTILAELDKLGRFGFQIRPR